MTALMKATINGHEDTVRMLLDAGADTSPADDVSSCVCVCLCVCLTSSCVPVVSYRMVSLP
jgi:hypothetical protein